MTREEYLEQLKDPRWYKVRDRIILRDGRCVICGSKENLRVHHLCYREGFNIWEYDSLDLATYCESCHQKFHKIKDGRPTRYVPILRNVSLNENKFLQGIVSFDKIECLFVPDNQFLLALFMKLCDMVEYGTNRTKLGQKEIKAIVKSVGGKEKKTKENITILKNMGFLKNKDGFWYINPGVFWKGDEMNRKKNYVKFMEL